MNGHPEYDDFDMDDDVCDYCGNPLEECACIDCALGPDGQCAKAGSEECDWDCPNSHGPLFCGSNAWHLRHQHLPVDGCECPDCRAASHPNTGEEA